MKAPMQTVPTASQWAAGWVRMLAGRAGSTRNRRQPVGGGASSSAACVGRGCWGRVTPARAAERCSGHPAAPGSGSAGPPPEGWCGGSPSITPMMAPRSPVASPPRFTGGVDYAAASGEPGPDASSKRLA